MRKHIDTNSTKELDTLLADQTTSTEPKGEKILGELAASVNKAMKPYHKLLIHQF